MRLAEKYIICMEEVRLGRPLPPSLLDLLCEGEGGCNAIPGNPTSDLHPFIVVYSIEQFPQSINLLHRRPGYCLGRLEKHMIERASKGTPIESIKIIIDRVDPGIAKTLIRISQMANEIDAKLQIDLMLSDQMKSIQLEYSIPSRI